jgi:hypothetical protein
MLPSRGRLRTGTTLRDFLRASDLELLPEEIVAIYDTPARVGACVSLGPPKTLIRRGGCGDSAAPCDIAATC